MRFGVHVPVGGGLARAVARAVELGCETIQIFSGNPRGWRSGPVPQPAGDQFRAALAREGIAPLVVHAIYLINPASSKDDIREKSVAALAELLGRCVALDAAYLVLHPGSHGGDGVAAGARRAGEALAEAWSRAGKPGRPTILLENVAGGGMLVGGTPGELAAIREAAGELGPRLGVCLDSCHAFAAGYDVRRTTGWERLLAEVEQAWWPGAVKVIHANDSVGGLGSHRDRHTHLGQGAIGEEGFRAMMVQPALRGLPVLLETPQDDPGHDVRNLKTLRRLWQEVTS
ncbi:MAG: deoxyribonuclease IV [Bacillota bacterium]|nr:deoxyribonuclease IV [Bacillota bacterium]